MKLEEIFGELQQRTLTNLKGRNVISKFRREIQIARDWGATEKSIYDFLASKGLGIKFQSFRSILVNKRQAGEIEYLNKRPRTTVPPPESCINSDSQRGKPSSTIAESKREFEKLFSEAVDSVSLSAKLANQDLHKK